MGVFPNTCYIKRFLLELSGIPFLNKLFNHFVATKKTLLLQSDLKEASKNEKNFSALNPEKKEQTWFQEKDVYSRRPESTCQEKSKRQEKTLRFG